MKTTSSTGFTLIELVIAVTIVGIIGSIAYPAYLDQVRKTRRSDAHTGLMQAAALQERWFTENNSYTNNITNVGGGTSPEGYYNLTLGPQAGCTTGTYISCFSITATPPGGTAQAGDTDCATLAINQLGVKSSTGGGACW